MLTEVLVLGSGSRSNAAAWYPDTTPADDEFSLTLEDSGIIPASVVEGSWWDSEADKKSGMQPNGNRVCTKLGTFPCVLSPRTALHGSMIAPTCKDSSTNCINSLFAIIDGKRVEANFLGYQNEQSFSGFTSIGLKGTGGTISLWDIPGAEHQGGATTYAVAVGYNFNFYDGKFNPYQFTALILPYLEVASESANDVGFTPSDNNGKPWVSFSGPARGCAWSRKGTCGQQHKFTEGQRFGLELKFEKYFTSWFRARLGSPDVGIENAGDGSNLITVSGAPVLAPVFAYTVKTSQMSERLKQVLRADGFPRLQGAWGISNTRDISFQMVDLFRPLIKDTSPGEASAWSFSNLHIGYNHPCMTRRDQVMGIVSTNSMVYQPGPPDYSKGFLNYEVSGMHYLSGGQDLALGSYDLLIRSSVARCLYGYLQAPLSGTVSVVNDKGRKVFATTTVSEKNGWLKLSAKGFTFSKKTIKIKITKAKPKKKKR